MSRQSAFIVFEGGEGSGKGTAMRYVQECLRGRANVMYTREPGGTQIGERIRDILLDDASSVMSTETELLLFLAARAQNMAEIIRPALAQGVHVIADRFGLSTIAYQIYRKDRHEYRAFLDLLNNFVLGDVVPHYVLFDVEPEVGLARARGRAAELSRFDKESLESHQRVRTGYLEAVKVFPHTIIDANLPMRDVHAQVFDTVHELLGIERARTS